MIVIRGLGALAVTLVVIGLDIEMALGPGADMLSEARHGDLVGIGAICALCGLAILFNKLTLMVITALFLAKDPP